MTNRKKKLRIAQISFLIIGIFVIFFTYFNKTDNEQEAIVSKKLQDQINKQLAVQSDNEDIFYNIEYAGLDLAGNRYILKSEEAFNSKDESNIVNMKNVDATFYFKDNTTLKVSSDKGIYNNETLDMLFLGNIRAFYQGSELIAQKAEYSNSKSILIITEKVRIKDVRGTISADKLFFDIKKQKLDIASFENNEINANVKIK
tara:strand:- start:1094 stop:1699 length:606 start_codon:yes stop_codon:yes gene_type:complete